MIASIHFAISMWLKQNFPLFVFSFALCFVIFYTKNDWKCSRCIRISLPKMRIFMRTNGFCAHRRIYRIYRMRNMQNINSTKSGKLIYEKQAKVFIISNLQRFLVLWFCQQFTPFIYRCCNTDDSTNADFFMLTELFVNKIDIYDLKSCEKMRIGLFLLSSLHWAVSNKKEIFV